jgi:uncharacterized membrane protein HdeD (DUF308 family)
MYYAMIILLMGVLPVASIFIEHAIGNADWLGLVGRWVVFWASGVRLLIAGVRQIANPAFTAKDIFEIETPGAERIVIELGFANTAMGLLSIASIIRPDFVLPAAIVTGLYYGLAGGLHVRSAHRNARETWAMASDLWVFVILAAYVVASLIRGS